MIVTINGKEEHLDDPITILELLSAKELNPDTVVVELNLNIIDKEALDQIQLKEKDVLEILRFVGGG